MDGDSSRAAFQFVPVDATDLWVVGAMPQSEGRPSSKQSVVPREQTETDLAKSRQLLQMVLDHVPGLVFWKNTDSVYQGCNAAFAAMAGFASREEVVGKRDEDMPWPVEQASLIRSIDREVMSSGTPKLGYLQSSTDAAGRGVCFRMNKVAMRDSHGQIIGVLATAEDISEEKRMAAEKELAGGLLEAAIAQSPSGILVADAPNVTIRIANAAAMAMRGADAVTLTGIEVADHSPKWQTFRPDGTPFPSEDLPLSRAVLHGEVVRGETLIIKDQHGLDHWVSTNAAPVRDAEGNIKAGVVVFHDITAQCEAEERLRHTEEQLSHLARLSTLGELIAGIAHELNHPLYAIQNLAKACHNVLANETAVERGELCDWCDKIASAATQAGAVVKNLRGFSRRSEFHLEPAALHEILEESIALLAYESRRHRVRLRLDVEGPSPTVNVDRIRIQQVLVNLIRNAFEAIAASKTKERKVVVRSRTTDGRAVVSIVDTGPGLPAHLGAKIFDPFVTTKADGMGLGLSISSTILEGHNSKLQVSPNPQGGTVFYFELPIAAKCSVKTS